MQTEYSAEMAQAHLSDIIRAANNKAQVIKINGTDGEPDAFVVPESYWSALQETLAVVNAGRVFPEHIGE
ncbi:hypothetical protein [Lacticaseibacillus hulanensis]|jgi:PHD/YefM family antitoxin component YafN of YafNO toxin-antitoxin module|uniref:hypothetical protein n=1 Tax=Lacticaseibacillus hulanensis TaxID=2493111 RepID=UPI000FDAE4F7|nr:hypothetical protein [Lacticaseibacillus hulanensis]